MRIYTCVYTYTSICAWEYVSIHTYIPKYTHVSTLVCSPCICVHRDCVDHMSDFIGALQEVPERLYRRLSGFQGFIMTMFVQSTTYYLIWDSSGLFEGTQVCKEGRSISGPCAYENSGIKLTTVIM